MSEKIIKFAAVPLLLVWTILGVLCYAGELSIGDVVKGFIASLLPVLACLVIGMMVDLHRACFPPPDRNRIQSFERR